VKDLVYDVVENSTKKQIINLIDMLFLAFYGVITSISNGKLCPMGIWNTKEAYIAFVMKNFRERNIPPTLQAIIDLSPSSQQTLCFHLH
jgi:hypothetical protein